MSSKQYREFARECLRWAEETTSDEDRRHFIDMARAWVQAAAELHELTDDHAAEASPLPHRKPRMGNGSGRNIRSRT